MEEEEGKVCSYCGEYQSLDEYYFRPDRNQYSTYCKECAKEKNHEKYLKRRGENDGGEYWLIPNKPGDFTDVDEKEKEAVPKFLRSLGWKYNAIYKVWVKKGTKEVKNGKVVWNNIEESRISKGRIPKKKLENLRKNSESQRTVHRPPWETLKQQIDEFGYVGTGKIYGKSDNAIRKWVRFYVKYLNL